jgi:hypothetical protein
MTVTHQSHHDNMPHHIYKSPFITLWNSLFPFFFSMLLSNSTLRYITICAILTKFNRVFIALRLYTDVKLNYRIWA